MAHTNAAHTSSLENEVGFRFRGIFIMAKNIKPRKKAYKPKVAKLSPLELAHRSLFGIDTYIAKLPALKKYTLSMQWDLKDVDRTLDLYCAMNNITLDKNKPVPLKILNRIYKGDLVIALRKDLIPNRQGFKITITCKARLIDDPSVVVPVKPYTADFSQDPIIYSIFMLGEKHGKHYFKRDGVFKTIWQGITKEWKIHLDEQYSDAYEIFDSKAVLTTETAFNNPMDEALFKRLKRENDLVEQSLAK